MTSQRTTGKTAAVGKLLPSLPAAPALQAPSTPVTRPFCRGNDHGILCCYLGLPFVSAMISHNANPTEAARQLRGVPAAQAIAVEGFAR